MMEIKKILREPEFKGYNPNNLTQNRIQKGYNADALTNARNDQALPEEYNPESMMKLRNNPLLTKSDPNKDSKAKNGS